MPGPWSWNGRPRDPAGMSCGGITHELEIDRDLDVVADGHATGLQRPVVQEPELATVNGGLRTVSRALAGTERIRALSFGGHVEDDFAGHAVHGQIAHDAKGALEIAVEASS